MFVDQDRDVQLTRHPFEAAGEIHDRPKDSDLDLFARADFSGDRSTMSESRGWFQNLSRDGRDRREPGEFLPNRQCRSAGIQRGFVGEPIGQPQNPRAASP